MNNATESQARTVGMKEQSARTEFNSMDDMVGHQVLRDHSSSSLRDKIMHDINRKRNDAMMTVGQCNELENDLNDETVKRVLRVLSIG